MPSRVAARRVYARRGLSFFSPNVPVVIYSLSMNLFTVDTRHRRFRPIFRSGGGNIPAATQRRRHRSLQSSVLHTALVPTRRSGKQSLCAVAPSLTGLRSIAIVIIQ